MTENDSHKYSNINISYLNFYLLLGLVLLLIPNTVIKLQAICPHVLHPAGIA